MQQIYYRLIKCIDKNLAKKISLVEKKILKKTYANDELAKIQSKSLFAQAMGFSVLNDYTSLTVDEMEVNFSYCLKLLEIYPVKGEGFHHWNEHVRLFTQLENSQFSVEAVAELQRFLQSTFSFTNNTKQCVAIDSLADPGMNFLLLLLHLDHLISKQWRFKSICLNQAIKFRYLKNNAYPPAKTFSDLLLIILVTNAKFNARQDKRINIPKAIPDIHGFEQWLDTKLEDHDISKFKQLIKKLRTNERFCYLSEVYDFLGLPYDLKEFATDELYNQVSKDNYDFLKGNFPEEKWSDHINGFAGLWLIYFWQNFLFEHVKTNNNLKVLSDSKDLVDIWKAFLKQYPSEGHYQWPSELVNFSV